MKINCSRCDLKKGCSPKRYAKLITKFGSEQEVKDKYLCLNCRKIIEPATEVPEVAAE